MSHDAINTSDVVIGWGKAGVAFIMIYIYTFGSTYAASPYAYAAEVLPTKNRATGMALSLFLANGMTLTFSQVAPIALETITWRFNLVFIACNCFFFVICYFFFPEVESLQGASGVCVSMLTPWVRLKASLLRRSIGCLVRRLQWRLGTVPVLS